MTNLAKILGLPLIVVATFLPLRCDMTPYYPHGTVNITFTNAPFTYPIDITAWTGKLTDINAIVGGLSVGQKTTSIELSPNSYIIDAVGQDNDGNYHHTEGNKATLVDVKEKKTYDISFTMN
jgi:hypothetical protein